MGLFGQFKSLIGSSKVDLLARYELVQKAFSGTMSQFYRARDRETGQVVGLKILDPKKTKEFEARFKGLKKPSEGEILAALNHRHIVKLLAHGISTKGEQFVVMEFLEGEGLNYILSTRSTFLNGRRVALIRQAAEALAAVHEAGYIYRDVCPRNYIVAPDGASLKLIDFGLTVPATPEFMLPGNRTGNPNYMAPELIKRRPTDVRVDIFAFGVTAYELCTNQLPWERGDTGLVAMTHVNQPPIEIERYRPKINPRLASAIAKAIERLPEERCRSMRDFLKMIAKVDKEDTD